MSELSSSMSQTPGFLVQCLHFKLASISPGLIFLFFIFFCTLLTLIYHYLTNKNISELSTLGFPCISVHFVNNLFLCCRFFFLFFSFYILSEVSTNIRGELQIHCSVMWHLRGTRRTKKHSYKNEPCLHGIHWRFVSISN